MVQQQQRCSDAAPDCQADLKSRKVDAGAPSPSTVLNSRQPFASAVAVLYASADGTAPADSARYGWMCWRRRW